MSIENLKNRSIGSMASAVEIGEDSAQTVNQAPQYRPKTVVLPKVTSQHPAGQRVPVDITAEVPTPAPKDENLRESLTKDILCGPNSPFEKYRAEKAADNERYFAEQEMAAAVENNESAETYAAPSNATMQMVEEEVFEEEDFGSSDDPLKDVSYGKYVESPSENESEGFATGKYVEEDDLPLNESIQNATVDEKPAETPAPDFEVETSKIEKEDVEIIVEEDDEEDNIVDTQQDMLKHLQKIATEKLKPISQSLNISSFTIAKKAKGNVSNIIDVKPINVAKWVLPAQKAIVHMKEFTGSELEALREVSEDIRNVNSLSRRYRYIYDHITSKKPASFEAWLKSTPLADIDHYFFAIFIANFKGAVYLPIDCTDKKCRNTFLTDDMPILNMVGYKDDEAKKEFTKLYQSTDNYAGSGLYVAEAVALNQNIAVTFRSPSIYNIIENAAIDDQFKSKYSSIIDFVPYIDGVYKIDYESQQLIPIQHKPYPENATKDAKSRIVMISKVLGTLSVDEFAPIRAFVNELSSKYDGIYYKYPSVTCPKCKNEIKETIVSAEELVFTRYQLGALVNTSLK